MDNLKKPPTSVPAGFALSNRITMPCIACGSPLAVDGQPYCPGCQREILDQQRTADIRFFVKFWNRRRAA